MKKMRQQKLPIKGVLSQKEVLRDLRNYLAGRAEGLSRDDALLEEVLKCTFVYHSLEISNGLPEDGCLNAEDLPLLYRNQFDTICQNYPFLFPKKNHILLGPNNILYVHNSLVKIHSLKDDEDDLIGDIYEIFIGTSYRGQEGQYFTPSTAIKALINLTNPTKDDLIIDPACGAGGFLVESCKYLGKNVNTENIHGIDKDAYLSRLTMLRLAMMFDGGINVISTDSLALERKNNDLSENKIVQIMGRYDLCLTNPPFGKKIVALSEDNKHKFDLAHRWNYSKKSDSFKKTNNLLKNTPPQILFLEKCITLLREGGRLGIVVPESIISNSSTRYVVNYILNKTIPIAVIGMPESLFKISGKGGTHTKVCLLVLEKGQASSEHKIFMSEAKWCGHDSRGKKIPHNDIPKIVEKFGSYKKTGKANGDRFGFIVDRTDIKNYILAPRYYNPEPAKQLEALQDTHELIKVNDLIKKEILIIKTGDEVGKLAYGTGEIPFVRTSDISNWEIKADPKHLVSEEHYNQYAKKQDVQAGDIFMVRDGTYLIGTCGMVTKYDTKILYQSHLLKIRVAKNEYLDNYLLLALLTSEPVKNQIKTLAFTQDIIDSLGDRLKDVMLPVPKDDALKKKISNMVKSSINERIEARELAKRARELVVNYN